MVEIMKEIAVKDRVLHVDLVISIRYTVGVARGSYVLTIYVKRNVARFTILVVR
jgi:hypothetical protein